MTQEKCKSAFIDCRGYFDLTAQIISIAACGLLSIFCYRNIQGFKRELQYIDNRQQALNCKGKILVLRFSLWLTVFISLQILFSIVFFIVTVNSEAKSTSNEFEQRQTTLAKVYKMMETICMNSLNCLILQAARLFWKVLKADKQGSRQITSNFSSGRLDELPCFYRFPFNKLILWFMAFNIICVVGSGVVIITSQQMQKDTYYFIMNFANLIASCLSIIIFVPIRIKYFKTYKRAISVGANQIIKQGILTFLMVMCCCIRILLNSSQLIFDFEQNDYWRIWNDDCLDVGVLHALLLFGITIVSNLIPPFVFIFIFQSRKSKSSQLIGSAHNNLEDITTQ